MARLLREGDVSTLIGLSVHWLRRKRRAGTGIPYIKMAEGRGGAVRYRSEDVDAFLAARVRPASIDLTRAALQKMSITKEEFDSVLSPAQFREIYRETIPSPSQLAPGEH